MLMFLSTHDNHRSVIYCTCPACSTFVTETAIRCFFIAMTQLTAKTDFILPNAAQRIADMCEHFREHDVDVSVLASAYRISYAGMQTTLTIVGDAVKVEILAPDTDALHQAKMSMTAHLTEYAGEHDIGIVWTGDKTKSKRQMQFRVVQVSAIEDLNAHLRRITFTGENLAHFDTSANLHCRIYFPQPGVTEPEWPRIDDEGLPHFPSGDKRLTSRTYTVRSVNMARHEIVVDIVLHGDAGPGSAWATQATVGQQVCLTGPGGQGIAPADWYLLAGDETALPAISRILEELPHDAKGVAVIEVDQPTDVLPLVHPVQVELVWVYRQGALAGTTTLLIDAVRQVNWPQDLATRVFAWSGAEFDTFKAIRQYVREERQLDKQDHLVVSYWRKGQSETA